VELSLAFEMLLSLSFFGERNFGAFLGRTVNREVGCPVGIICTGSGVTTLTSARVVSFD